jgi:hypothetical protein
VTARRAPIDRPTIRKRLWDRSEPSRPDHLRDFAKKIRFQKNSVLSLPPMFDRVSSDTMNYGGYAECPVPAQPIHRCRVAQRPAIRMPLRCAATIREFCPRTESDLTSKASARVAAA